MLPQESYLTQSATEQINSESINVPEMGIQSIQCGDEVVIIKDNVVQWATDSRFPPLKETGIVCNVKDMSFPFRSSVDPNNMYAMNMVKSLFIEFVKISNWTVLFLNKQAVLDGFNRVSWKILSPFILKDKYLSGFCIELRLLVSTLLENLGMTKESSYQFAQIFSHIIENDNAYNLRIKDLFTEMSKALLISHPRKELNYVAQVIRGREVTGVRDRASKFIYLLRLLLLIPKYKKAFTNAISNSIFANLMVDDNDVYWSAFREDYKFGGKDKSTRIKEATEKGWKYPQHLL